MDIFYNNVNNLPQQVEENRENIAYLMGLAGGGDLLRSDEILISSGWQQSSNEWLYSLDQPYVTQYSMVYVAFNDTVDKCDDFNKLYKVITADNLIKLHARSKPNVNLTITVWWGQMEDTDPNT